MSERSSGLRCSSERSIMSTDIVDLTREDLARKSFTKALAVETIVTLQDQLVNQTKISELERSLKDSQEKRVEFYKRRLARAELAVVHLATKSAEIWNTEKLRNG